MPAGGVNFAWISAASDGTLYGIDTTGTVHRRDAQTATRTVAATVTNGTRIAARSATEFYAIRASALSRRRAPPPGSTTRTSFRSSTPTATPTGQRCISPPSW